MWVGTFVSIWKDNNILLYLKKIYTIYVIFEQSLVHDIPGVPKKTQPL